MTSTKNSFEWPAVTTSSHDLELSPYNFFLPEQLIATRPKSVRDQSRLLVCEALSGKVHHSTFAEVGQFLPSTSTLILNQSKVFKARLLGKKATGGACEVFVLSLIQQNEAFNVMIKSSGAKKIGDEFHFDNQVKATLTKVAGDGTFWVKFSCANLVQTLQEQGILPIPPYIRGGEADEEDQHRYQTVFSKDIGSVAAPTAGLHFTDELMNKLKVSGHELSRVTLHVGAGTFQPVKTENILEHQMHAEYFSIDQENSQKISKNFGNLVPVGTTALRTLQSCIQNGAFKAPSSNQFQPTSIFLHPGKSVYGISGLITNFHLPKSTLLMLVSSLLGREKTLELYQLAIKEKYRFFSYGDAMLILNK